MPTVFLSSTVHDLEDLRGALQDWLESKGFEVVSSDLNDFDKSGDANSYDACFAAVEKADHFLLLVGDRRGGLYEFEPKPISVTRQEYRVAYRESQRRPLPIHAFVRKRTWRDKYLLEKKRLTATDDIVHQVAFLREVGRTKEMKAAQKRGTKRPRNNWIHRFESFRDIRAALEVNLDLRHDVETQALCSAIQAEIEFVMGQLLHKITPAECRWPSDALRRIRTSVKVGVDDLGSTLTISRNDAGMLFLATLRSGNMVYLTELPALNRAMYWHRFADHEPITGTTKMSVMQRDIRRALLLLKRLELTAKGLTETRARLGSVLDRSRQGSPDSKVEVPAIDIATILGYGDDLDRLQRNIVGLGMRFVLDRGYVHLEETDIPRAPFDGQDDALRREEVTPDDVRRYLADLAGGRGFPEDDRARPGA